MSGSINAVLREKIDTIRVTIQRWGALPIRPSTLLDIQPFCNRSFLVKNGDQIMVRTNSVGDLNITFDDLVEDRIGIGMNYLSMLENRLPIFKEILDEVATDPSDETTVIEEIARVRGAQELHEIPSWNGPSREIFGFEWTKRIGSTFLIVAYFRDEITEENVTRGLIVPSPPRPQWLIKDGRRYEWNVRPEDRNRLLYGDFVDTDLGAGEVIDEDVSVPTRMANYLDNFST